MKEKTQKDTKNKQLATLIHQGTEQANIASSQAQERTELVLQGKRTAHDPPQVKTNEKCGLKIQPMIDTTKSQHRQ